MSFISTLKFSHIHKASKWQNWGLNENLLYFQGIIFSRWSTGSLSRFAMLSKVLVASFLEMKFFSPSIVFEMLCSYWTLFAGSEKSSSNFYPYLILPRKKNIMYITFMTIKKKILYGRKQIIVRGLHKNLPRMYIFCWWNVNGRHKILLTLICAFKEPRW